MKSIKRIYTVLTIGCFANSLIALFLSKDLTAIMGWLIAGTLAFLISRSDHYLFCDEKEK